MVWYDYLIILGIIIGLLFALFGTYHGRKKTGMWGWMIIFLFLIIRAFIWLIQMF